MSLPTLLRRPLLQRHCPVPARAISLFTRTRAPALPEPLLGVTTRLENGLRVTTQPTNGELATVGIQVLAGSQHQLEDDGTANLVRLAVFRRTLAQLASLGIHTDSFTNRDHTVYTLTCPKKNINTALTAFASLSRFSASKMFQEDLEVVQEQLLEPAVSSAYANKEQVLFDHLHSIAYQGSSLGYSVLGSSHSKPKLDQVSSFYQKNYTAPRILISGAGIDSHQDFVQVVRDIYGDLPNEPGTLPSKPRFVGSMVNVRDDYIPKVHIMFAVEASAGSLSTQLTLQILQAALGDWDASYGVGSNTVSRLGETIALEGLGSKAQSFLLHYPDSGLLGIYGVAEPHQLEDFSVEVLTEFVRVSQKLSQAEIDRARTKVKNAIIRRYQTTRGVLETISSQVWDFGARYDLSQVLTIIDQISSADIRRLAGDILYDVDPVIAATGPTTHIPDYNRMRSWIYWNRF